MSQSRSAGGSESGGLPIPSGAALPTFQQRTDVIAPILPSLTISTACWKCSGRTLLRADLDDALMLARGVDHRAAFLDGDRGRLFDVDVLAGGAGHHGLQRVPVIGRAEDDGVDRLVVDDAPEIGDALRLRRGRRGLVEIRLVDVAHRDDVDVGEPLMVAHHADALPARADQRDADAIVRALDARAMTMR